MPWEEGLSLLRTVLVDEADDLFCQGLSAAWLAQFRDVEGLQVSIFKGFFRFLWVLVRWKTIVCSSGRHDCSALRVCYDLSFQSSSTFVRSFEIPVLEHAAPFNPLLRG